MPLHYQWQNLKINQKNIKQFIDKLSLEWKPKYITFDTETTGLHLTEDKPFYLSLAFVGVNKEPIAAGLFLDSVNKEDLDHLMKTVFLQTSNGFLIGHNVVFDLNMMENIGYPCPHKNLLETMVLIRLTTDAVQEKYGGAPLKLKRFASQYIDKNAKSFSKKVDQERTKLAKQYNTELYKIVNKKEFEIHTEFPKDIEDFPPSLAHDYAIWLNTLPEAVRKNMTSPIVKSKEIPYSLIDREILGEYGTYDAIYTYEIFDRTYPLIEIRKQTKIFEIEQQLIYPLYKMAREGFHINKEYIFKTKETMKKYLMSRMDKFIELAGEQITVSQSIKLKGVFETRFDITVSATNEPVLLQAKKELEKENKNHPAIEFIELIFELRTLSKWYSTYLMKFFVIAVNYNKIHASINSAGAVTGRFTSDFQQFPRDGIKDNEGNTLFHPRHMIQRPDNDNYLLFIDYSQMELRLQALYTILLGTPDKNLCQAYMPYKCHHYSSGVKFNYKKPEHIKRWNELQDSGESAWLLDDTKEPWVPVDVHAQTTAAAYPNVSRDSKEFLQLRKNVGKHANFACNYGARAKRIAEMFPDMTWEEAKNIYEAYRETFPGTIAYHKWCYDIVAQQGYGENLFNRRYYNISGHNYLNAAIQGTGADLLKIKMIEIFNFLKNYKSKLIMTVHDELIFVLHRDELHIIKHLMGIMEELEGTHVPIVVEAEISNTTWAEKRGFRITNGILTINT